MILETPLMRMPALGLGTWPMKGADCRHAVESALALGYRHIDTAEMYGNEDAVGAALAGSALPREEIFLTTKVWWDKPDEASFHAAALRCLERLRQPFVDLLLVHWPSPAMDLPGLLRALARLRDGGQAKAVGVSNFPAGLLRQALALDIVPLACLQVEHHVMLDQSRLLEITGPAGMVLTSYTPLGKGGVTENPVIQTIARRHGATGAQVALAAILARGRVAAIPKAAGPERQRENLGALSLRLTAQDLHELASLPGDRRFVNPDFAPDWAA